MKQTGNSILGVIVALGVFFGAILTALALWGWVWNIIKVFSTEEIWLFITRLVGIVIPIIGAVLGYI